EGRGRDQAEPPHGSQEIEELAPGVSEVGAPGVAEEEQTHAREDSMGPGPAPGWPALPRAPRTALRRRGAAPRARAPGPRARAAARVAAARVPLRFTSTRDSG